MNSRADGTQAQSSPGGVRRTLGWMGLGLAIFGAGAGAGFLARPFIERQHGEQPKNYEIRPGRTGLTNPLLDCEMGEVVAGGELRPFHQLLEGIAGKLTTAGAVNDISIYFRDLDNGPWFGVNERDLYTPASLLKVPLILACLKQAEGDPSFLARQVRYDGSTGLPPGSFKPEVRLEVGKSYPVEELVRRTAVYSDNESMALLEDVVDPRQLRSTYAELGFPETFAADRSETAAVSAYDYGRFFRVLYNASYLGRAMSEKALRYFADSSFSEGIEAGVPPGVEVAHKFGVYWPPDVRPLEIQLHDCGIVYRPGRAYFLCVMTRGKNYQDLKKAIAEVSRAVSGEMERQGKGAGAQPP